jgi:two-component system sensor histidine kinase/response regulator
VKPTILIVDDHDAFRSSLRGWLNVEFPQYSILEALNGEEAITLARAAPPTLVIMDLRLPRMNGIETTQAIKAFMPDLKVVILSIYEDQIYYTDATAAGVNAYIPKRKIRTALLPTITMMLMAQNDGHDQNEFTLNRKKKEDCLQVLLVQDETFQRLEREHQIRALGFACISCSNATTALEVYLQTFYPLIIIEFCRQIRALPGGEFSKILVVSARDEPEDLQAAFEAGANSYLTKPDDLERLNSRIKVLAKQMEQDVYML